MGILQKRLGAISCIVVLLLLAGCSSPRPDSIAITSSNEKTTDSQVKLDEALSFIESDDGLRMGRESNYTIHNIIGKDLTTDGRAATWTISINTSAPQYLVYKNESFSTFPWTEASKDHSINLDIVISPEELFSKHTALVTGLSTGGEESIDELELRNGIYYLRSEESGTQQEFKFDATTGIPIPE